MYRMRMTTACVLIAMVLWPSTAARAEIPACRLGGELRQALGFGAREMAALGVSGELYSTIVAQSTNYCDQNRETIEPFLVAVRTARSQAQVAYENGTATAQEDQAILTALGNVISASSTIAAAMRSNLSLEQQEKQERFAANAMLDTRFIFLDLTTQDRNDLQAAQRTRDLVLLNHKQRKRSLSVQSATQAFANSVEAILQPGQVSAATAAAESLSDNLTALLLIDAQTCGAD